MSLSGKRRSNLALSSPRCPISPHEGPTPLFSFVCIILRIFSYLCYISRQEYPNASLPWTEAEDLELTRMWCEGATEEKLSAHFRRKPGAIRSRIGKLDLERLYGKHRPF